MTREEQVSGERIKELYAEMGEEQQKKFIKTWGRYLDLLNIDLNAKIKEKPSIKVIL